MTFDGTQLFMANGQRLEALACETCGCRRERIDDTITAKATPV
jgi:hypothetical protein